MLFDGRSGGYPGHYVVIRDIIFQNYKGVAISGAHNSSFAVSHIAVINNTFRDFGQNHTGAIQIGSIAGNDHWIVRGNRIQRIGGASSDGSPSAQHGVYITEGTTFAVVDGNTIDTISGYGIHGWGHNHNGTPSRRLILRQNTIRNVRLSGIITGGTDYSDIYIYNNTFYSTSVAYPAIDTQQMRAAIRLPGDGTLTRYRVLNDLAYGPVSTAQFWAVSATPFTSSVFDYNNWVNTNSSSQIYNIGGTSYSLSGMQSATVYEDHAKSANPLFTNISSGDFTLQSTSPAMNAGTFLTTTVGSGSGTTLTVADAGFFTDGFGLVPGDMIQVGSNSPVRITTINYGTNAITVAQNIAWSNGQGVSLSYSDVRPDMGAHGKRSQGHNPCNAQWMPLESLSRRQP